MRAAMSHFLKLLRMGTSIEILNYINNFGNAIVQIDKKLIRTFHIAFFYPTYDDVENCCFKYSIQNEYFFWNFLKYLTKLLYYFLKSR